MKNRIQAGLLGIFLTIFGVLGYNAWLLETTPGALVGLFRRAPRLTFGRHQRQAAWLLPQINATDYADLFEKLQSGSRWNSDFIVMLTLAAGMSSTG